MESRPKLGFKVVSLVKKQFWVKKSCVLATLRMCHIQNVFSTWCASTLPSSKISGLNLICNHLYQCRSSFCLQLLYVTSGKVGCEFLENFTLMGVTCGPK